MNNKKFNLNVALAAVLTLNFLAVFGIFFGFKVILNEQKKASDKEKELSVAKANIRNIENLKNLLNEIGGKNKKISSAFLSKNDFVGFIETLENLSRSSGLEMKITSIELGEKDGDADEKSKKPVLSFTAGGRFQDIVQFISLISYLPYQVEFDSISLQKSSLGNEQGLWDLKINITVLNYE